MSKTSSRLPSNEAQPESRRVIARIDSNHPARVKKEYLTHDSILAAAQARKLEYVSPLRAAKITLNAI
jgi:hypothetical protein